MNSEAVVSLGYMGYITANIIKDNIKIWMHNNGTQALGNFLTKALVSNFNTSNINVNEAPLFIDIRSGNTSILKHPVYLTGGTYGAATGLTIQDNIIGACKFSTVVQSQDLKSNSNDLSDLSIKLLDNSIPQKNILASISDSKDTLLNIVKALKSQDVVIEWVMLITNPEIQTTTNA